MNDTDVRDERLGDLLDRAVRDVEPGWEAANTTDTHGGKRTVRIVAAVAAAATFVGVIAWAATQVERDTDDPVRTISFAQPDVPWTFDHPSTWNVGTLIQADPGYIVNVTRTVVLNGELPERTGAFGAGTYGNSAFTDAAGPAGAAVVVERYWSLTRGSDESAVAHGPGPWVEDSQRPGWRFRERSICEGTVCMGVTEWHGPEASETDGSLAARIAASVRLANLDRWTETDGALTMLHNETGSFTVTHPNSWTVADGNLTPWLAGPIEILSLGTFPLRVSSHPDDGLRIFDAPVAPAALEDMTARDAFVSLQEGAEGFVGGLSVRPDSFRPDGCTHSIVGCGEGDARTLPFQAWWTPFEDEDRGLYLFVAIGNDASPDLVDQAWAVADSLRFYPSVG